MGTQSISSTSWQPAATSQEVVVTQIWSFLVLFWSFPYNIMLGSQKPVWDLQLKEKIIVQAPQREQKPIIQVEITRDLKSRCTMSYPLTLNARANYFSHLTQCHAVPVYLCTTRGAVVYKICPTKKGLWFVKSSKWESNYTILVLTILHQQTAFSMRLQKWEG